MKKEQYETEKRAIREWHEEHGAGAYCYAAEAEIDSLYEEFFGGDEE